MGQVLFENFDFLVKVKGPLGQSIFFFFFFFFFYLKFFAAGSDRVRFPGRSGSNRVVEDDVIHDVMRRGHMSALGASSA